MSEHSESERTEEATPRKRDEARTEGRIPRSAELTIAASLLGSAVVLSTLAPVAGRGLFTIMGHSLSSLGSISLDVSSATALIRETAVRAFAATAGRMSTFWQRTHGCFSSIHCSTVVRL